MARLYYWLWFVAASTNAVDWVVVDTISNVHVLDRITTIPANTIHNCVVECYSMTSCVTVGYSYSTNQCQLYDLNIADFQTGFIGQPSTTLYRAACSNTDYTYIRQLTMCLKFHTNPRSFTDADSTCDGENSELLRMDTDTSVYLTRLYPQLAGTAYYVNARMFNSSHVSDSKGQQLVSTGTLDWITGGLDISKQCMTLTWNSASSAVGYQTSDCGDLSRFFCGHPETSTS